MRTNLRVFAVVGALALTPFVASCGGSTSSDSSSDTSKNSATVEESLAGTAWKLDTKATKPKLGSEGITIAFTKDGGVSGRGPCNGFHGEVSYEAGSVDLSKIGATMMACEDDVMADEAAFLKALEGSHEAKISADSKTLTLSGNGDVNLVWSTDGSADENTGS